MKRTLMYEKLTDLYPLFRESMEERKGTEKIETNFCIKVFQDSKLPIKTVIDLGGGIGMHAGALTKQGFDVTVFDQSKRALTEARKRYPTLKTIHGSFEKIPIKKIFDAAICLWSTFPYILSEKGRKHFFRWVVSHIRHIIILDEANFYRYLEMKEFHKAYQPVENDRYRLMLTRDWIIDKEKLRQTSYAYTITDKRTGKGRLVQDWEVQHYLSVKEIQNYLGSGWGTRVFGDFKQTAQYDKQLSSRLISVFTRTP